MDKNTIIYDKLFASSMGDIDASEYDIVNSELTNVFNDITADTFTMYMFAIAKRTNTSVLDILNSIKGKSGIEITSIIAHYLNSMGTKHVLYGVRNAITPNYYIARNVVT